MVRTWSFAVRALFILLGLALGGAPGYGQAAQKEEYTPSVGQEGKDVIWVPTPHELIQKMLDMAKVTSSDIVYDLGSGDGRTVIAAAKRGAQAIGIEYNPDMVELSRRNAAKEGVAARVKFIRGDIFETDFSQATVVTLYLLPQLNLKLRPKILDMKPGTRVASHAFTMDDWQADETASVDGRTAYFWVVPAKVEGIWRWQVAQGTSNQSYELTLRQKFQMIEGSVKVGDKLLQVRNGKVRGDQISFSILVSTATGSVQRDFSGRVVGNTIVGAIRTAGAAETKWNARRS